MRFHLGFSKFISIKTIIKILGFLFVGLMAFLGFTQHEVLAWTNFPANENVSYAYITENDRVDSYNVVTTSLSTYVGTDSSSYYGYSPSRDNGSTRSNVYLATTQGSNLQYLLDEMYIDLPTTSLSSCATDDDTKKSFDLIFNYTFSQLSQRNNGSLFLLSTTNPEYYQELLAFDVIAIASNNNSGDLEPLYFITPCDTPVPLNTFNNTTTYGENHMTVTCHNAFPGSADVNVTGYQIRVQNKIPFNNIYNSTTNTGYIGGRFSILIGRNDTRREEYPYRYQCSDSAPIVEGGGFPSEDPNGLNDVWVDMQDNFDADIPGIDTEQFIVNLPATFTDLLSLPLDVVKAVVNNSTGTCSPYQLDFSSLVHRWGNPNDSFIITLPCMRQVLSSKLGTIYNLCDNLLCFFIFYNMAMLFINLINAILSGEDLFAFYFKPVDYEQSVIHGKRGHWHVRNNFTRGGVD